MPNLEDGAAGDGIGIGDFTVISQRVDLDVDFAKQTISGSTQILAQPLHRDLKAFRLNARQCRVTRATVEGKPATVSHLDPYDKLRIRRGGSSVHQHDYLKSKIAAHVKEDPDPELRLGLPPRVTVKELDANAGYAAPRPAQKRKESDAVGPLETPTRDEMIAEPAYAPMKIYLEFRVESFRDGLHWVGTGDGDGRFPHVYTTNTFAPGVTSCVFPCIDNVNSRYMWEISIRCDKTLGDAFRNPVVADGTENLAHGANGESAVSKGREVKRKPDEYSIPLSEEERALDLAVVCSGEMTDDIIDPSDPSRRTVSFACATPVAARHIGFAIGPFETIDLSAEFRHADEDDKLGQSAVKVLGYCLPGRGDELRNTCLPMPKAIDYFTVTYGSFPFPNYKMCFVDDLVRDTADTAGLSILSTRLLFPESIIDTLDANTRSLVLALATQYSGINVVPKETSDVWAVVGVAGFMSDMFMKKLAGNNEYRFRQKLASDRIFEQDVDRYSLQQLGGQLDIDPSEYDFMQTKASLVLFILDRRLTKQSGSTGMNRIITRVFLNAKTGDLQNSELTTESFLRICEKLGHAKLDSFFKQWVYNAGCPDFMVTQKFNKKKLVVEMTIQQMQSTRPRKLDLEPTTFMREAKEQVSEAYAPEVQPAFVGPMTIQIHEADGTPYEHIVEIKDVTTRFEIPYNTKYKRLKRSKRAKERSIAINGPEQVGDSQDDVLLYCLGDTLQSEQEVKDWFLVDWTEQQENQMGQESYEWIRMDADFEWIGRMNLNMPIYMYVSQLQQDRDIVAQYESVQRIIQQEPHPMGSTILVRTLMDRRYFHGLRTTAAMGLTKLAVPALKYIGLFHLDKAFSELYCEPGNPTMPRPNDFGDRASYLVQCTIPRAMATVRDPEGRVPLQVRRFLFDKIKFNDNTYNENSMNLSDNFYLAMLVDCLFQAVASMSKPANSFSFAFDDDEPPVQTEDDLFRSEALSELERYRNSDEWTPSYQNVTTLTAIACIERLIAAGFCKDRAPDLLAYTRLENAENVRLRAFQALVNLNMTTRPPIMKYMLNAMSHDSSPRIRSELLAIFGQALGSLAIKDEDSAAESTGLSMEVDSGLVLEQEVPADARALELARKSSPEGALQALRVRVENDTDLKEALWSAILSDVLTLQEVNSLLDVAALLFESSSHMERLVIALPLPRYWKAKTNGLGKITFSRSHHIRMRPSKYSPLSLKDSRLIAAHGLRYTGTVVKTPKETKEPPVPKSHAAPLVDHQALLQAKIAETQRELERQQRVQSNKTSAMSPPPLLQSDEPRSAGGLKLSFKRKQSMDAGQAPSPKIHKSSKNATANGSVPGTPLTAPKMSPVPKIKPPKARDTQSAGTTAANTNGTRPSAIVKLKTSHSKLVKLRFPTKSGRIQSILSTPSKHSRSKAGPANNLAASQDSYFPPPPRSINGAFPGLFTPGPEPPGPEPEPPTWNAGGFRSFSTSSEVGLIPVAPAATSAVPSVTDVAMTMTTTTTTTTTTNGTTDVKSDPPLLPPLPPLPSSPDDVPLAVAAAQRNGAAGGGGSAAPESRAGSERSAADKETVLPPTASRKITLKFGKKGAAMSP